MLRELEPFQDRLAHFSAALCIASSNNQVLLEVQSRCEGIIAKSPRGDGGFGYDPIFEVLGTGLTYSEMGEEKKQVCSHRGRAFELLRPGLERLIELHN